MQFVVLVSEEGMGGPTMSLEERSDFAAATCDAENVTACFPPNGKPTSHLLSHSGGRGRRRMNRTSQHGLAEQRAANLTFIC